ncbi:MAG: hypothetical protein ACREPE_01425 [Lysobacter sp.]
MKQLHSFLALSLLLLTTACDRQATAPALPADSAGSAAATLEPPATRPALDEAGFIELPLDGSTTLPHTLTAGQSLSGEFAAPLGGQVTGVEVLVGNYDNSSTGTLAVKLCQGGNCAEGTADLATSQNNAFFPVALAQPLALAADGMPVSYQFTRATGDNLFALWVYPSRVPTSKITKEDGTTEPATAKIRLGFAR